MNVGDHSCHWKSQKQHPYSAYAYDLFGNPTDIRFANNRGFAYSYDGKGRLTSVSDEMTDFTRIIGYEYDVAGLRTALVHPDGTRITYGYDDLGRLSTLKRAGTDLLLETQYLATGELDRRLQGASAFSSVFGYDGARRPVSQDIANAGSSADLEHTWSYNQAGQVTGEQRDNAAWLWDAHPSSTLVKDYTANGLNQYTAVDRDSYSYDANGNLTDDGVHSYVYDTENRLVEVSEYSSFSCAPIVSLVVAMRPHKGHIWRAGVRHAVALLLWQAWVPRNPQLATAPPVRSQSPELPAAQSIPRSRASRAGRATARQTSKTRQTPPPEYRVRPQGCPKAAR